MDTGEQALFMLEHVGVSLFLILYGTIAACFTGGMLIFHIGLLHKGIATYEWVKQHWNHLPRSPFSRGGFIRNLMKAIKT
jgi:hypothetical protein